MDKDVKELLEGLCFGYAWYNQGVGDKRYYLAIFKERVFDIDTQAWQGDVEDMGKLRTYKLLKEDFICESYLNEININSYTKIMT